LPALPGNLKEKTVWKKSKKKERLTQKKLGGDLSGTMKKSLRGERGGGEGSILGSRVPPGKENAKEGTTSSPEGTVREKGEGVWEKKKTRRYFSYYHIRREKLQNE